MMRLIPLGIVLGVVVGLSGAEPPHVTGAAAFLADIEAASAAGVVAAPVSDEAIVRQRALAAYHAQLATSSPEAMAEAWLALVELNAGWTTAHRAQVDGKSIDVYAELPPPEAWPKLVAAIDARQAARAAPTKADIALRLVAATLTKDPARVARIVRDIRGMREKLTGWERTALEHPLRELGQEAMRQAADANALRTALDLRAEVEASCEQKYGSLGLPDLVAILGEDEARRVLDRLLTTSRLPIEVESGDNTRRLARTIAVERIGTLAVPQWSLAQGTEPEAMALYEALTRGTLVAKPAATTGSALGKLFGLFSGETSTDATPDYDPQTYQRTTAQLYYLVGLVINGRIDEATLFARTIPADSSTTYILRRALADIANQGGRDAVLRFLSESLAKDPGLPFWEQYLMMAAHAGTSEAAVTHLTGAFERVGLAADVRARLRGHLVDARLAADQLDVAIPLLREELAASAANPDDGCQRAIKAWRLAQVVSDADLGASALASFYRHLALCEGYIQGARVGELAEAMRLHGVHAGTEEMLRRSLIELLRPSDDQHSYGDDPKMVVLSHLVGLYHEIGRHEDVRLLLDKAPWWGAADLATVLGGRPGSGARQPGIAVAAAASCVASGKGEAARRILHAVLALHPGHDGLYRQLLALDGADALPYLERLFERDQFEERPLIWKARILLDGGNPAEAEAALRAAIAIDPSDGEQPRGDRLRAYAFLAEAVALRGDQAQSDVLRGAVSAIRTAEDADQLQQAGLLSRAVERYRKSLVHFADAYCIQSRLAVQLAGLGRANEAAEHYRRAYELMPDSFGRMESHCFGCEGAFDGKVAQEIAETVFVRAIRANPGKPQSHYMLAYLRAQQQRYADARDGYREALRLDPDYINAWKQLAALHQHVRLEPAVLEAAALAAVRLNPLGRHSQARIGDIGDLPALWRLVDGQRHLAIVPPERLLALPASGQIDGNARNQGTQRFIHHDQDEWSDGWSPPSPAAAIARHALLVLAENMTQR